MKVILKNTTLTFNTRERVTKVYEYPNGWVVNQYYSRLAPENVGHAITAETKDDSVNGNRFASFEKELKAGDTFSIESYSLSSSRSIYGLLEKDTSIRKRNRTYQYANIP